jgi:hypothetical protein
MCDHYRKLIKMYQDAVNQRFPQVSE